MPTTKTEKHGDALLDATTIERARVAADWHAQRYIDLANRMRHEGEIGASQAAWRIAKLFVMAKPDHP